MNHYVETVAVPELAVQINAKDVLLRGDLAIPESTIGVILFAHGSGSGRQSPRNQAVAQRLQNEGFATLLLDLLTEEEELTDIYRGHLRFDIRLLGERLVAATDWLIEDPRTSGLRIGYFGASTGAAAALVAATRANSRIRAIVSRGGRPDLAGSALSAVRSPTLLIVGGNDEVVLRLNRESLIQLGSSIKRLEIVPGASHLFEEPGKLDEVGQLATDWFTHYFSLPRESPVIDSGSS
mgnify:CR=1 FL=1